MKKTVQSLVSDFIGWDENTTAQTVRRAPITYRRYEVPKKKGGMRVIYHPAKKTKAVQYAIINQFLLRMPIHEIAAAYVRNIRSPLLKNATCHAPYSYSVRVDIKDFFPSIKPQDLLPLLDKQVTTGKLIKERRRPLDEEEQQFLTKSLFVLHHRRGFHLAIGAPCSPIICNIVMFKIDDILAKFAKQESAVVTRYADDFVYSTNEQGECSAFVDFFRETLRSIESPKLTINTRKTLFMSRGTRRVVTGLYVTPDGKVSIGRKNKRYIRKLLFDLANGRIASEERKYLQGYLSYILDVEPFFFNRLVIRYGSKCVSGALNYYPS